MSNLDHAHPLYDPESAVAIARGVATGFAGRAQEADERGLFLLEDLEELRRAGLLGLMVPKRLGGPGASFSDYAKVAMVLAQGSGASALVFNMHASVTGVLAQTSDALARGLGATEAYFSARDKILRSALAGSFFAVAMSERGAGSRLSALATTYTRTSESYRITGVKSFVSGAYLADAFLVAARAVDDAQRVSFFLVPAGDGVRVEGTWDVLGMRGTGSYDLRLDVEVAQDSLLGGVEGLAMLVAQVMPQWLVASYAAVYAGVAKSAIDAAVVETKQRSLGHLPSVRARLGRATASVAAAELLVLDAASRVDRSPGEAETNRAVYQAKLVAGQTATEVASSLLEAAGTSSIRKGNPLERIYRDARCGSLQPATSDVCADWLGMSALGLNADDSDVPRW